MKAPQVVVLLAVTALCGCPPPVVGSAVDVTHPSGRAYTLGAVAALTQRQPADTAPVDPVTTFRGEPGRALPAGAVVTRLAADDPRAVGSVNRNADPATHPWVFVEVTASPIATQVGWAGWTHVSALSSGAPETNAPGEPDLLTAPSYLCAWPDGAPAPGPTCGVEIHPTLPLDILGCDGDYVHLQLWDPTGNYVAGFIRRSAFALDPCPR